MKISKYATYIGRIKNGKYEIFTISEEKRISRILQEDEVEIETEKPKSIEFKKNRS